MRRSGSDWRVTELRRSKIVRGCDRCGAIIGKREQYNRTVIVEEHAFRYEQTHEVCEFTAYDVIY